MSNNFSYLISNIKKNNIEFLDLRFTDLIGVTHRITILSNSIDENFLTNGKAFDGSSIPGWKSVNESDMILIPDIDSFFIDPFHRDTIVIYCSVFDPYVNQEYACDPRSIAKKCEKYLRNTKIADTIFCGPEIEFFIFDKISYAVEDNKSYYEVYSSEAKNASTDFLNNKPRISNQKGYAPLNGDSMYEVRCEISKKLKEVGQIVEIHHHEVGSYGQCEIGTKYSTLLKKSDEVQTFKYIARSIAKKYNKTITFMPKPIANSNGSGMHVHQSLFKDGDNIFFNKDNKVKHNKDLIGKMSDNAIYYIGGILKHAKSLNAFCNPSINSYKRLVSGFEAPTSLSYSSCNRSAAIRIPLFFNKNECRIEIRFSDTLSNPYLCFSALMMAGIDGINNKIYPGKQTTENLYKIKDKNIKKLSSSLSESIDALENDHDFLIQDNHAFNKEIISSFINLKRNEIKIFNKSISPVEFDIYYEL